VVYLAVLTVHKCASSRGVVAEDPLVNRLVLAVAFRMVCRSRPSASAL
jgi:hypothetical protein